MSKQKMKYKSNIEFVDRPLYHGFTKIVEAKVTHDSYDDKQVSYTRELTTKGDAVVVMLIDEAENTVLLVEQFRVGAHREAIPWTLELVAGMIDEGETPVQAAIREVREECGIELDPAKCYADLSFYPSVGTCDELHHLIICPIDLHGIDGKITSHSPDENIKCVVMDMMQALNLCSGGVINTGSTILALYMYMFEMLHKHVYGLKDLKPTSTVH